MPTVILMVLENVIYLLVMKGEVDEVEVLILSDILLPRMDMHVMVLWLIVFDVEIQNICQMGN